MSKTLIIADDNPGHIRLIKTNLKRSNFQGEIVIATNGKDVLNTINERSNNSLANIYLLLDLNMPIISGFKVLQQLKSESLTQRIPIIVLTTTDNPKEIERCYDLHANWCLTKPIDYSQFKTVVQLIGDFISKTV